MREGCGVRKHSSIAGGNANLYYDSGNQYDGFSEDSESTLPQYPAIPPLGIYSNDAQSYYKDICSSMFIATLFVLVRTWKQPSCPSTKEWIRKYGTFTQWNTTQQ